MAAAKTVDEYQKLDAGDESLARWKASLGLNAAVGGDTSQPMVSLCLDGSLAAFIYTSRSLVFLP
jgi:hypothetical protein